MRGEQIPSPAVFWGPPTLVFLPPPPPPPSLTDELCPLRQRGGLDSGFNSVDSGSKRWSGNEVGFAVGGMTWVGFGVPPPQINPPSTLNPLFHHFSPRMSFQSCPGSPGRSAAVQVRTVGTPVTPPPPPPRG